MVENIIIIDSAPFDTFWRQKTQGERKKITYNRVNLMIYAIDKIKS